MPGPNSNDSIKRLLPWLVAVALFMESLDTTILNTAVPTIAAALGVGPLSMKAALTSYTLSLAVFIPISGWVADRFGTRRVFSSAIATFTVGSLLCGLSTSVPILVAARILQGCGGAMMMPVGRITIVRTFPKSDIIRAMSFVAIPGLIGPLVGPLAGGLIVHYLHWRMIFFVNLPIGVLGLYLAYRHMPDYRSDDPGPLDFLGMVLFGIGVAVLSYVLEVFGEHTLGMQSMLVLFAISAVSLGLYGRHALRVARPLLMLSLFKKRTFRASIVGSFATRLGIGGMPFLLPLMYQIGLGYSPVQSGLLIMPQPLAALSLKLLMAKLLNRFGYRRILVSNTLMIGLIIVLFATIDTHTPMWLIVIQAFIFGFVSSLQYTSMNTLVFADLNEKETSNGSTISSTVQQMSMSFGVAVASLITAVFLSGERKPSSPEMVSAIRHTFVALGIITMASTFVFRQLKPGDGANVSQQKGVETPSGSDSVPHVPEPAR